MGTGNRQKPGILSRGVLSLRFVLICLGFCCSLVALPPSLAAQEEKSLPSASSGHDPLLDWRQTRSTVVQVPAPSDSHRNEGVAELFREFQTALRTLPEEEEPARGNPLALVGSPEGLKMSPVQPGEGQSEESIIPLPSYPSRVIEYRAPRGEGFPVSAFARTRHSYLEWLFIRDFRHFSENEITILSQADLLDDHRWIQHYSFNPYRIWEDEASRMIGDGNYALRKLGILGLHLFLDREHIDRRIDDIPYLLFHRESTLDRDVLSHLFFHLVKIRQGAKLKANQVALDTHMHVKYSFHGAGNVASSILHASHRGLNALAITDHDSQWGGVEGSRVARELKQEGQLPSDFVFIPGQEVSSSDGHIIALFAPDQIYPQQNATEAIKEIHGQGGLAIIPHPDSTFGISYKQIKKLKADGVAMAGSPRSLYRFIRDDLRGKRRLPYFVESDAHDAEVVGGLGYTLLDVDEVSAEGVKDAIRAGRGRPGEHLYLKYFYDVMESDPGRIYYDLFGIYDVLKDFGEEVAARALFAENVEVGLSWDKEMNRILDLVPVGALVKELGKKQSKFNLPFAVEKVSVNFSPVRIWYDFAHNQGFFQFYKDF